MDARWKRLIVVVLAFFSLGASYRTQNFIVNAPTPQLAKEIGDEAERLRKDLAVEWLGEEMRNWARPCPIVAHVRPGLEAGGVTSFMFNRGEVFDWNMSIQGTRERTLDSVLPHEVLHTVFATHFRQALPRWADEGACSTVEHSSERARHQQMLIRFLKTGRGISFNNMFSMKNYPKDIHPLYAQGHSVASYLLAQGGKRKFLEFVGDGLDSNRWGTSVQKHYGYENLGSLQESWLEWVRSGSPELKTPVVDAPLAKVTAEDKWARKELAEDSAAEEWVPKEAPAKSSKMVPVVRSDELQRSEELPSDETFADYNPLSRRRDGEISRTSADQGADERPRQATRPQSPQPAKQVILEWNQSNPTHRAPAAPQGQGKKKVKSAAKDSSEALAKTKAKGRKSIYNTRRETATSWR